MGLVDHEMRLRKLEATPPGEDPRVDGLITDVQDNTVSINRIDSYLNALFIVNLVTVSDGGVTTRDGSVDIPAVEGYKPILIAGYNEGYEAHITYFKMYIDTHNNKLKYGWNHSSVIPTHETRIYVLYIKELGGN